MTPGPVLGKIGTPTPLTVPPQEDLRLQEEEGLIHDFDLDDVAIEWYIK